MEVAPGTFAFYLLRAQGNLIIVRESNSGVCWYSASVCGVSGVTLVIAWASLIVPAMSDLANAPVLRFRHLTNLSSQSNLDLHIQRLFSVDKS